MVILTAPHLKSKDEDPGVIVFDAAGQFVIPDLSRQVEEKIRANMQKIDILQKYLYKMRCTSHFNTQF